ncbi:hypothetical protein [Sphingomonas sp.]
MTNPVRQRDTGDSALRAPGTHDNEMMPGESGLRAGISLPLEKLASGGLV